MFNVASTFWSLATARYSFLLFKMIIFYGRCQFPLDNSEHFLFVEQLFCRFSQGERPVLLTGNGAPIAEKKASLTVGPHGPILLQDFVYLDEISHFNRERIPERVVHAKGAGTLIHHVLIIS